MKLGLQLRVQPQQKKQPARTPLPTPLCFNSDDDDDDVERDILRQAHKNKTNKDVEKLLKKTLEEDSSAFEYDGVFDEMKAEKDRDRQDNKPKYIPDLKDNAEKRGKEQEVNNERKRAKERSEDDVLFPDKEKFVSGSYKKKLAERAKWEEEERIREMREEKEEVTKKTDLSDFYFSLGKNVAFGATEADGRKPDDQKKSDDVAKNHHKRSEDAVAAAKAHFWPGKRQRYKKKIQFDV